MNDIGRNGRWGLFGGIGGVVLGGFTWVVVAGFLIRDPLVWGAGIVAAAVVGWVAWRLFQRWPMRILLVMGWVVLLVGLLDIAFLIWVVPRLPVERMSIWIGSDRAAFAALRPWAIAGSAVGAFLVLYDAVRARRMGRPQ